MGDVIRLPRPGELHPLAQRAIERLFRAEDCEAQRRVRVYAAVTVTGSLLRILARYPWMRLTHARRVRWCAERRARIEPGELHFVKSGVYVCQSGTYLDGAASDA